MRNKEINDIVDFANHPINNQDYRSLCKEKLDQNGALVLDKFITNNAINNILIEANNNKNKAFYCKNYHNIYLNKKDNSYPDRHPRNREIISSKGCITDDQISDNSALRCLYNSAEFQSFLCSILDEESLYKYYDNLSSINIHYANNGQELGWHFDNSSFAITLLIQNPNDGGKFEYICDFRYDINRRDNYENIENLLD